MPKTDMMKVRVQPEEKESFEIAASIAGVPLSAWIRERLRKAARFELEEAGRQIPFIQIHRTVA